MEKRSDIQTRKVLHVAVIVLLAIAVSFFVVKSWESKKLALQANALTGYWTFDESGGNTGIDLAGKEHAKLLNGAHFAQGLQGNAVAFDGVDDAMLVENLGAHDTFSVMFWVKPATKGEFPIFGGIEGVAHVSISDDARIVYRPFSGNDQLRIETLSSVILPNVWNHIVITQDGRQSLANIYVDGVKHAIGPVHAETDFGVETIVGAHGSDHFAGLIDDIRVFDYVVDDQEVTYIYKNTATDSIGPSAPGGIQAHAISPTEAVLTWRDSHDNADVAFYHVYRDGKRIGVSAHPTFTDLTLEPGVEYRYAIRAIDTSGNESDSSESAFVKSTSMLEVERSTDYRGGDLVELKRAAFVVDDPFSDEGSVLSKQSSGDSGLVLGGGIEYENDWYWLVAFGTDVTGWVSEFLIKPHIESEKE